MQSNRRIIGHSVLVELEKLVNYANLYWTDTDRNDFGFARELRDMLPKLREALNTADLTVAPTHYVPSSAPCNHTDCPLKDEGVIWVHEREDCQRFRSVPAYMELLREKHRVEKALATEQADHFETVHKLRQREEVIAELATRLIEHL